MASFCSSLRLPVQWLLLVLLISQSQPTLSSSINLGGRNTVARHLLQGPAPAATVPESTPGSTTAPGVAAGPSSAPQAAPGPSSGSPPSATAAPSAPQAAPTPSTGPSAPQPAPSPSTGPSSPQAAPSPSSGPAASPTAPAPGALSLQPSHPLDPLTPDEVSAVRQILITNGLFREGNGTVVAGETLYEPTKATVKAWSPGQPLPPRQAQVVLRQNNGIGQISTVIVDISNSSINNVRNKTTSGFTGLTSYDTYTAIQLAKQDPRFAPAVAARGLNTSNIICQLNSYGYFNRTADNTYILPIECFDSSTTTNYWMQPLTGIEILVDVVNQTVYQFIDTGPRTMPPSSNTDYRAAVQGVQDSITNFITCSQAGSGSNIQVQGNVITWSNFRFHVRYDQRIGIIVSNVTYNDAGVQRDIMYQGNVDEIFVPYEDPSVEFYYKSYFDGGDIGLGSLSKALVKGIDCPENAYYYNGVDAGFDGFPRTKKNMVCVFERNPEEVLWRHTDTSSPIREARPELELVARFIANSGNYDYIFDWIFRQDGLISMKVGTSGELQTKAVNSTNLNSPNGTQEARAGTFVNENLIAVYHDHFFNFRLDLDVDGQDNSYVIRQHQRLVNRDRPRQSYWTVNDTTVPNEQLSITTFNYANPRQFYISNLNKQTRLGNPISYRLVPTGNTLSVLDPNDYPSQRAPWTNYHIAVTSYNSSEKFASGQFTNQAIGDDTLSDWIANSNNNINNTDIVLWYTMGMHHIPTQDQFPVMPTEEMGFHLQPANFFERNPVLGANPFSADNGIYEQQ